MPRFSVIIPVRDRPVLLMRAVDSVIRQTFSDWECHIIDDGSLSPHPRYSQTSPASSDQVSSSSGNLRQLQYRYFPRSRGVSWARNRGFLHSRGEWIAFLDSDDEWLPDKLAEVEAFIAAHPHYKIFQTGETWVRGGKQVNPPAHLVKRGGDIFGDCLERCMITASSVVIHRSLLDGGSWDEKLPVCEDYDLWIRLSSQHPIGLLPRSLTIRYQDYGEEQLSQAFPVMDRFRLYALKKLIRKSSGEQRRAAIAVLRRKAGVVLRGAWRRRNLFLWLRVFLGYRISDGPKDRCFRLRSMIQLNPSTHSRRKSHE